MVQERIWLYCHDHKEAEWAINHCVLDQCCVMGISYQAGKNKIFPHSGLTPVMQAAIRGGIDLLMVANLEQLGQSSARVDEVLQILNSYGVSVKSFCNMDSSNS